MKLEYYKELKNALKNGVQGIKYVGYFNDQFNKEKQEQSIDYPCILISIKPQDFKDVGGGLGVQTYNMLVTLHIGYTNFKDQGEDILDFAERANIVAHTFVPTLEISSTMSQIGKLMRIDERPNYDHDQVIVHEMDYLVSVKDHTCDKRNTKEVTATPVVTATYQ